VIHVLDAQQMREADRAAIDGLGVPSLVLMEMAAVAVTDTVCGRFADASRPLVVCGAGNNGGDGLAVARQLRCRGFEPDVALVVPEQALRGDAAAQLRLARAFGIDPVDCSHDVEVLIGCLGRCDLVIDAILGTGLDRAVEGHLLAVVEAINAAGVPVIAVDLPSGLSASAAAPPGPSIEAALTVTFAAPKIAHVLPPASLRCGEVAVADIGIPPWLIAERARAAVVEEADVRGWLPRRGRDAHKGRFGHLLIVAGREGRAGAAALASRAAVTLGAGLVTVATARGAVLAIQAQVPEAMVDPLPTGDDGAMTGEGVEAALAKATAVAVGPGLGLGEGPRRLFREILERWDGPLLLDADALTLLGGGIADLASRTAPTVLTPHPGELGRLLGRSTAEAATERLACAREAASSGGCVVLAKGAATVIAQADGFVLINPTGSAGLASGGTGDVLTGCVGAFLAQSLGAVEAAAAGAWLHGRAAELAAQTHAGAVPASVVIDHLAGAERELRELG
jgi:NAD(P)H-hydrate epimerase